MAGRRKGGSAVGTVISTIVLIVAVAVFAYAAWMLYGYYREYKKGTDEYANLNDSYVSTPAQDLETQAQTETDPASGKAGGSADPQHQAGGGIPEERDGERGDQKSAHAAQSGGFCRAARDQ